MLPHPRPASEPTGCADLDAVVERDDHDLLRLPAEPQLLCHVLAHTDRPQSLQVGQALENQDVVDEGLRVQHLLHAELAERLVQPVIAPVEAHL